VKLRILLLTIVVTVLMASINLVNVEAQGGIIISTPREETFIKVVNEIGAYGWDDWNPIQPPYASYEAMNSLLCEFLFYDNLLTGERIWWLATGMDYSEDFKTVTLHLREGVHWNDGVPFTSEDVVWTVNLHLNNPEANRHLMFNEWIESVEAPDNYTVVFHLKKPNYGRFNIGGGSTWNFFAILPKHIWENVDDPISFSNKENPVFTGPYKVYKLIPESKMMIFIRDENYWGKSIGVFPAPKYVVLRNAVPADLEYINWLQGAWDYTGATTLPPELIELGLSSGNENITVTNIINTNTETLKINCRKYPLSIPEVRWAISYCIDREKIANLYPSIFGAIPNDWPWAMGWGVSAKWKDEFPDLWTKYGTIEYNPDKAAEILDSLNIIDRDGDGIRETENGTKLSFQILASSSYQSGWWIQEAQVIAEDLRKVGIDAQAVVTEHTQVMDRRATGMFDAAIWVGLSGAWSQGDPLSAFSGWHSQYVRPIGEKGIGGDAGESRWSDPELDSIIEQMQLMSPDDPRYKDLARQGFDIWMKNLPNIPIITPIGGNPWSSRYWTGFPTEGNYYIAPQGWSWPMKFILNRLVPTGAKPSIPYMHVWFTAAVDAFTGVDGRVYGPFSEGDYAKIPTEDADRLLMQGVASTESPIKGLSEILTAISSVSDDVASLQTNIASSITEMSNNISALNSQTSTLTTALIIEAVAIIMLAVVILMRKK